MNQNDAPDSCWLAMAREVQSLEHWPGIRYLLFATRTTQWSNSALAPSFALTPPVAMKVFSFSQDIYSDPWQAWTRGCNFLLWQGDSVVLH